MPYAGLGGLLLEAAIRAIGALWFLGAIVLYARLRREAMMDGMLSKLSGMAREMEAEAATWQAEDEAADPPLDEDGEPIVYQDIDAWTPPPPKTPQQLAAEAWEDRDDIARRRVLAVMGVLLMATGLSMAALHPACVWLAAAIVAAQGVYFIWREWTARRAPTPELAAITRPQRSTQAAGWFSLFAAGLVWLAAYAGLIR
jgi:hypothetical protein